MIFLLDNYQDVVCSCELPTEAEQQSVDYSYGKPGALMFQVKWSENGKAFAQGDFIPYQYAIKLFPIMQRFNEVFRYHLYRHMWE